MLLREMTFVAIDFETTGVCSGFSEEAWQIGLAVVEEGKYNPNYAYNRFLRIAPNRPFNPYVPGKHATIRELLSEADSLSELWTELAPWLENRPLLSHNAQVEQKVLAQAFPMHQFGPWVDTLAMARESFPLTKSHKLSDLIPALGLLSRLQKLCPNEQPHDAWYDAIACGVLFEYLLTLPMWRDRPLQEGLF